MDRVHKWKLCRKFYGNEQYILSEGEQVSVGRAEWNNISLPSYFVSRIHCKLSVIKNEVFITDLNSANGVYVDDVRIPQNKPYKVEKSSIVGIGWTVGELNVHLGDDEKYIYQLLEEIDTHPFPNKIQFGDDLEENVEDDKCESEQYPVTNRGVPLKRKADAMCEQLYLKANLSDNEDEVNQLSDSDTISYSEAPTIPQDVSEEEECDEDDLFTISPPEVTEQLADETSEVIVLSSDEE